MRHAIRTMARFPTEREAHRAVDRVWLAFAKAHGLPIVATVKRPSGWEETQAYTGDGVKINSGFLDGLPASRGCSAKGKFWSSAKVHDLTDWVDWCQDVGRTVMGKVNKKALRQKFWPSDRTIGG